VDLRGPTSKGREEEGQEGRASEGRGPTSKARGRGVRKGEGRVGPQT